MGLAWEKELQLHTAHSGGFWGNLWEWVPLEFEISFIPGLFQALI